MPCTSAVAAMSASRSPRLSGICSRAQRRATAVSIEQGRRPAAVRPPVHARWSHHQSQCLSKLLNYKDSSVVFKRHYSQPYSLFQGRLFSSISPLIGTKPRGQVIFNINDDFNRESMKIEIDTSLPSARVIRALDDLVELRGAPRRLRLDNGPEFISAALRQWAQQHGATLDPHPARQAHPERLHRMLQPHLPHRSAGPLRVHHARRGSAHGRGLASSIQPPTTTSITRRLAAHPLRNGTITNPLYFRVTRRNEVASRFKVTEQLAGAGKDRLASTDGIGAGQMLPAGVLGP